MAVAQPGAAPLGELAAARRRRRLGQLDRFEAFYDGEPSAETVLRLVASIP